MARMIPPAISPSCTSPGEKEVFTRLKDEPATQEWIVLHSLDIAHHQRQVAGEADFLIIVPHLGVLCLEVKACRSLHRRDGLWYYGRDPKGDARGPFKQASEAMHSLRKQVVQHDPALSRVLFWSAVAFPYVEFSAASDEWHSWQIIDAPRFRRQPLSTLIRAILGNARTFIAPLRSASWFSSDNRLPDSQQAAAIARVLRPNFEFLEAPQDRRARHQTEILHCTEEQFAALDAMADNDRVLFTGPAGTGKTVLAIEAARRAGEDGKNVLLLCFNRLLGAWLGKQPALQDKLITARTVHQYLLGAAAASPPPDADDAFWRIKLPDLALARLLDDHGDLGRFDLLVVDEVQDILEPAVFDVLDAVLKGGLNAGRWLMFGDFERQMLYGQDRGQADQLLQDRCGPFTRCSLRVNCRNTPRVATLSHLLGKLAPNYSRVLRPDDRIEPSITYYATPSQQRRELAAALDRLQKESFADEDIVVLSPKAAPRCAAASLTEAPWPDRLAAWDKAKGGQIPYTTIQSFKGLEAPTIVVTDLEHVDSELFSSLFYVATTRALERLCLIVHETAKAQIVSALLGKPPGQV